VLKLWRRGPNGRKMAAKGGCFVAGRIKLFFFVTGQIGMKFRQAKSVNRCPLLIEKNLKIFPYGVTLPHNRHSGVFDNLYSPE